jgi:DNA-binding MarR family transcriptional regulator
MNSKPEEKHSLAGALNGAILQELSNEIGELRFEMGQLQKEIIKHKQRIDGLEKRKKIYGKDVMGRVNSMLILIEDYGGSLKSSSIKKYMGLSKDELYRTIKCAKESGLIEVKPDSSDRRGSVVNIIEDGFQLINDQRQNSKQVI